MVNCKKKSKKYITIKPTNTNDIQDVKNAKVLEEIANTVIDRTDIPLVIEVQREICTNCLPRSVSCKMCMVIEFSQALTDRMTRNLMNKIKTEMSEEDIEAVLNAGNPV